MGVPGGRAVEAPADHDRRRGRAHPVGGYLRGTTILSAIIAATDLVFMLLLGVPLAVPLPILVFLAGYIPYFGGIVTTAIILLVTWATVGNVAVMGCWCSSASATSSWATASGRRCTAAP